MCGKAMSLYCLAWYRLALIMSNAVMFSNGRVIVTCGEVRYRNCEGRVIVEWGRVLFGNGKVKCSYV